MAYVEWGDPKNPEVVVCVHGLTRNGRDFDRLAQALAGHYRVICPDVVGRGRSDWLQDSAAYGFPQYIADMLVLLARLDTEHVHWVGTSMGGLIGMFMAAMGGSPIKRLVLNDVGPRITGESLRRIGEYVGRSPDFDNIAAAEAYLRQVNAPFGKLSDADWRHLTEHSVRAREDGRFVMCYDPAIGQPFRQSFVLGDVDLWPVYDRIMCPVLLTRGAESDLLDDDTARAMTERGPRASRVDFPAVGHAPMFMDEAQIATVRSFLAGNDDARAA
jgi:pimeloyl-ACP methyl ester carboxylesterase